MTLKNVITAKGVPLGSTPEGNLWCMKALHPADVELPAHGIPDSQARHSALIQFTSTYTIAPPPATSSTWGADIMLRPDPLCFGSFASDSDSGFAQGSSLLATPGYWPAGTTNYFLNPQVPGAGTGPTGYTAKLASWLSSVKEHRLVYYGATLHLNAPALSNQGTVVAAQFPVTHGTVTNSFPQLVTAASLKQQQGYEAILTPSLAGRPTSLLAMSTLPGYTALQNIPGSYFGEAKDGVYVPLKLAAEDFHYVRSANTVTIVPDIAPTATVSAVDPAPAFTNAVFGSILNPFVPASAFTWYSPSAGVVTSTGTTALPWCTDNLSVVALRGMSVSASVTVTVRCAFQLQVAPGTTYSPYVVTAPPYDPVALAAYTAISREMEDAYPASYNDFGDMLEEIAEIAGDVLPMIFPALGSVVGPAKKALKGVISAVRGKKKTENSETSSSGAGARSRG